MRHHDHPRTSEVEPRAAGRKCGNCAYFERDSHLGRCAWAKQVPTPEWMSKSVESALRATPTIDLLSGGGNGVDCEAHAFVPAIN
jgi:hypothetical protein